MRRVMHFGTCCHACDAGRVGVSGLYRVGFANSLVIPRVYQV